MTSVVLPQGAGRAWRVLAGACLLAVLAACGSSGSKKPEPAPLAPVNALLGVRQAWSLSVGASAAPLSPAVLGNQVWVGSSDGSVVALDAAAGRELWRAQAGAPLAAGVGSDGNTVAVVTVANELVAMEAGRVVWRARLGVGVFTPPLVAGGRYDRLLSRLGAEGVVPAVGFAAWVERLALLAGQS